MKIDLMRGERPDDAAEGGARLAGRRGAVAACALALLGLPSCVPVALPPARIDAGFGPYAATPAPTPQKPTDPRAVVREAPPLAERGVLRASGGLHLASLMPSPSFPLDVGVGYGLTYFPGPDARFIHSPYAEVSPFVVRASWWRVQAGVRGELLIDGARQASEGYGVFGRVGVEAFRPVSGAGVTGSRDVLGGAGLGMLGAGFYIEAGTQKLPGGERATMGVFGLTLRTPAAFGVLCCAKL